ncbi:hypothetical protein Hdeb2414_s0003g00100471 [Helianthus debilis subsp. tardiflorus]
MEEANFARNRIEKSARKDLQSRDVALAEVNRRLVDAEEEARAERAWTDAESACTDKAEEDYQRVLAQHTTSSVQLEDAKALNADLNADRQWMCDYGVVFIANAILGAPEVDATVIVLRAKARDAGYKAGDTECLTHVNVVSEKKFTDE